MLLIPELPLPVKPAVAKACCRLGSKHLGFCHVWLPSQLTVLPRGSPPAAVEAEHAVKRAALRLEASSARGESLGEGSCLGTSLYR